MIEKHVGQRRIRGSQKNIFDKIQPYAWCVRDARIFVSAAAFDHLGVTATQASLLAQVGHGVPIGQERMLLRARTCTACAREEKSIACARGQAA